MTMQDETAGSGLDLTDQVTVFVTTVGAPSFADCLAHLRAQDCRVRLRVIDHVAPMHVAFQRMLDECRTPYYVQVDEDMLLEPHAVRTLHARIATAAPAVAMVAADLHDPHLQRCIIGVKIFRHAIVRRYPFTAGDSFENAQVHALEADGYRVVRTAPGPAPVPGQTLGRHGTHWTTRALFERCATLERRRRAEGGLLWFEPYGREFFARFERQPTDENFFALMGVVAGILASGAGPAAAKDYRRYADLPGFAALQAFLAELAPARAAAPAVNGAAPAANGTAPARATAAHAAD